MECTFFVKKSNNRKSNPFSRFSLLDDLNHNKHFFFQVFKKIKIVGYWFETKSIATIRRKLQTIHGLKPFDLPSRSTIVRTIEKWNKHGGIGNVCKGHSGRERPARTQYNVDRVLASDEGNPKTSCKRRSQELMLTKSTVHRILRKGTVSGWHWGQTRNVCLDARQTGC